MSDAVGRPWRPLRILSIGSLDWCNGYEVSLLAVQHLIQNGIRCDFRIVGDGPHRGAVVYAMHDLKLTGHVNLFGSINGGDFKRQLSWADVLVDASITGGFDTAVAEAQSMRVPVIATDVAGSAETIRDQVTGFIVAKSDSLALADRLMEIARDPDLRRRLGESGRKHVQERFELNKQHDKFSSMYEEVIDPRVQAARISKELSNSRSVGYPRDELAVIRIEQKFSDRLIRQKSRNK